MYTIPSNGRTPQVSGGGQIIESVYQNIKARSLDWIDFCSPIVLGQGHLHEFGNVQSERKNCYRDNIDQQSSGIAHSLRK